MGFIDNVKRAWDESAPETADVEQEEAHRDLRYVRERAGKKPPLFGGGLRDRAAAALAAGEHPTHLVRGRLKRGGEKKSTRGLVIVTDRRVMFAGEAWDGANGRVLDMALDRVAGVEVRDGEMGITRVLVVTGPAGRVELSGALRRERMTELADAIRHASRQPPPSPSAPTGSAGELERLAALHASGVLTADEFAAAKARVLGL